MARKDFAASFVRAGQKRKVPTEKPQRGLLEYANDWVFQIDFKHCPLVFPPCICATSLRPDAVLWSMNSRTVILIELTCCAEEGVAAAQSRKEARYEDLLATIRETKMWTARLLTVEVGARGLVGSSTHRAFVTLGLSSRQANALCKRLSVVVARCSYAIYLAHNSKEWPHNNNLIELTDSPIVSPKVVAKANVVAS